MGVGAPHWLVERAVRVAREVVWKDNLREVSRAPCCQVKETNFTRGGDEEASKDEGILPGEGIKYFEARSNKSGYDSRG